MAWRSPVAGVVGSQWQDPSRLRIASAGEKFQSARRGYTVRPAMAAPRCGSMETAPSRSCVPALLDAWGSGLFGLTLHATERAWIPAVTGLRPFSCSVTCQCVNGATQLYGFELEPEVRDWLDNLSLSDSDFRRVDEVCGMLTEGHRTRRPVVRSPGRSGPGNADPARDVYDTFA
jgi:hypothetical protein